METLLTLFVGDLIINRHKYVLFQLHCKRVYMELISAPNTKKTCEFFFLPKYFGTKVVLLQPELRFLFFSFYNDTLRPVIHIYKHLF